MHWFDFLDIVLGVITVQNSFLINRKDVLRAKCMCSVHDHFKSIVYIILSSNSTDKIKPDIHLWDDTLSI